MPAGGGLEVIASHPSAENAEGWGTLMIGGAEIWCANFRVLTRAFSRLL